MPHLTRSLATRLSKWAGAGRGALAQRVDGFGSMAITALCGRAAVEDRETNSCATSEVRLALTGLGSVSV